MFTRHDRRGLEVVEAAITLPIMLFILVALVNLGYLIYAKQAAQSAANYGARMGSVAQGNRAGVAQARASEYIAQAVPHQAQVSVLAPGGVVGSELKIEVQVEVPNMMGPLAALLGGGLDGPLVATGEASFRAEGW